MIETLVVPDIGEGVEAGKVVAVHIQTGNSVGIDDTVIELETDKAVVEIPSPLNGKVVEVFVGEGDEINVGDVIARIEIATDGPEEKVLSSAPAPDASVVKAEQSTAESTSEEVKKTHQAPKQDPPETKPLDQTPSLEGQVTQKSVAASPSIRRLARELGVDIHAVRGSGPGGRISEGDIKSHVKAMQGVPVLGSAIPAGAGSEPELPDFSRWGEVETVALDTVRRITAHSTAISWHTIPHVTQFDKADITGLDDFVDRNAKKVANAGGKLTVTAILTKVCAEALKKFPRFNASIDLKNERLILKKYIHIALAVDTPRGLLMPVIQAADTKSITQLAVEIVDLAQRSRNKKIRPTELEGGTFSISNQGGIGGVGFTPIVLWPQVAILGVSRAAIEPRLIEGQFQPRHILPLSLSYDHRMIDGADAARFLRWICASLEQPFTLLLD